MGRDKKINEISDVIYVVKTETRPDPNPFDFSPGSCTVYALWSARLKWCHSARCFLCNNGQWTYKKASGEALGKNHNPNSFRINQSIFSNNSIIRINLFTTMKSFLIIITVVFVAMGLAQQQPCYNQYSFLTSPFIYWLVLHIVLT